MSLPLAPPWPPQEAQSVKALPAGEAWVYEPKWDGFRCIAFRDGGDVELQSKAGKPLGRYFPEVVEAVRALAAPRFVIDSEIVIPIDGELSFESLLQRVHPAESRVRRLVAETPALVIAFDLLVGPDGELLTGMPFAERRQRLESFATSFLTGQDAIRLSPETHDLANARQWLTGIRGGVDGVMAKRLDMPYHSGERTAMRKVKRMRTADCVVGGFRYGTNNRQVGSLLLGLYDAGRLHHVGFTSGIRARDKPALTAKLERLVEPPGFTGRAPGGPSRWATERSAEWMPLRPELVVEVEYDHFSEGRFRHGTRLVRWRPDKAPEQCTLEQVEKEGRASLELL